MAATVVAGLLAETAAFGGTVSLEGGVLVYRSDLGEKDRFAAESGRGYVDVAGASPGRGCFDRRALEPFANPPVRCPLPPGAPRPRLQVELGDGNDEAEVWGAVGGEINGGAGRDGIKGGSVPGSFNGGAGGDTLDGMGRINGGPGGDSLYGTGRNVVVHGGPGADLLEYHNGAGPARLFGGPGQDSVTGSTGADLLRGGAGPDHLFGYEGRDILDPGPGVDIASATPRANLVRARDGRFDYIACLDGRDKVMLDRFDFYERDCEQVRRRGVARSVLYAAGVYLKRDGHRYANELEIHFSCPYDGPHVCDPTFLVDARRGRVLRGVSTAAQDREGEPRGIQEWVWNMRPKPLLALARWARITMLARDRLGRPYQQTIVCTGGAVRVPLVESDSVRASVLVRGRFKQPLTNSRTCDPPWHGLDPGG